jgi:hypothetical protein
MTDLDGTSALATLPEELGPIWARVNRTSGCWLWTGSRGSHGYGQVTIRRRVLTVHRLVWEALFGPIPQGSCVLHRCDVRNCVRPDHLFLGTRGENSADMWSKGRGISPPNFVRRGEEHRSAKLTAGDVRSIRTRAALGANRGDLARNFGVTRSLIGQILRRRIWRHL